MARPSPQTDRVVALLGLLAARPDHGPNLAEVTKRLGVNKSTCHAMLSSLTSAGWLLRDPRRKTYRLGPVLIGIGRAASEGFPALAFARGAMLDLSHQLRLHCAALAPRDGVMIVLDQVLAPDARGTGLHTGMAYPLRPPFGTTMLAWADERAVEAWLTQVSPARRAHYRAALAATRRNGFTVELSPSAVAGYRVLLDQFNDRLARQPARTGLPVEELLVHLAELADHEDYLAPGLEDAADYRVNVISAPIFADPGQPELMLAVTGFARPRTGRQVSETARHLLTAADDITRALGGVRPV